ncbi:MAG: RDD family protein [Verrucomicrobiae bacterium]|nr:RDD family protein [Verrucomicrobiae bacterium]
MNWFYAIDGARRGPVSANDLALLSRTGKLGAEDLAWRDGMPEWRPFRRVAGEVFSEASGGDPASPIETAVCAHTGRALPLSELVPYGDRWIDPQHKESFVQRLMEVGDSQLARDEDSEMVVVGFWWRFLSWIIDYMVLILPSMICMIPYFFSAFAAGVFTTKNQENPNPFSGWTAAIMGAYALGVLGQMAVQGTYHTWMVKKYQGTVGKMAIGAKIVTANGDRVTTWRAFSRWLCSYWLNGMIAGIITMIGVFIGAVILGATASGKGEGDPSMVFGGVLAMMIFGMGGAILGMFPYWMAAFDPEKRALHDRICATRVVKK